MPELCLMSEGDLQMDEVMRHELAPVPTAMFSDTGDMISAKQKSKLKSEMKIEIGKRNQKVEAVIVDGNARFWTCYWPEKGLVEDLAESYFQYVVNLLKYHDVYLVFDRYYDYSIKGVTRADRAKNIAFKHNLSLNTPLPSRPFALGSSHNKVQLIEITSEYVCSKVSGLSTPNRLFVTSANHVPKLVHGGTIVNCDEMRTSHEEADIILVQQCFNAIANGCSSVNVISDDTDVFVLLVHLYEQTQCNATVLMEDTHGDRTGIDIGQTAAKHSHLAASLPAIHALTGCDSTSRIHGIGKKTALNVGKKAHLPRMGIVDSSIDVITEEATRFIGSCYGIEAGSDMSSKRYIGK